MPASKQLKILSKPVYHLSIVSAVLRNPIFCPGKEAAMGIIVVSLTYTAYHWGSLIAFWVKL